MKKLNLFLMAILAILLILLIYFFIGGTLSASVKPITAAASEQTEAFQSIQNLLNNGTAPKQFADAPQTADGCTLIDATITLRNRGFFPAEWISVNVIPASGDIAVYSLTGEGSNIAAGGSGQLNLKLITTDSTAKRTVEIQYYVFGMLRTVKVSF